MDDRWSGTGGPGGPGNAFGPADAPGPGYGQGPPGFGPPGYGPPGFGPPEPFAPPGPDGRAARRYLGAYVASGILLIVFACVLGAWIADTAVSRHADADGLLESLVMNDPARPLLVFTAHEWAFAVALIVVGIAALARRRLARGAALLLAFLLLGVGVRQISGLARTEYRDVISATEHGTLIVLTYVFAFLAAAAVITLMLVARERDLPREPVTAGRRAAGVLLILIGALQGFWYARNLREYNDAVAPGGGRGAFSEWWHKVLNINARGGYGTSAGFTFYHSALIAAFLVVGVLLLRDTPAARGAALALLGISAYLQLRDLAGIQYDRLSEYYRDTTVGWSLTSSFAAAVAILVAIALTRRPPRPHVPPPYPTAPLP
ncbi:hypothetical protein GCM10011583_19130 [Streptomyces camponoticapitis]|uniref:Uncharacterized protein n=1 Tax=Streptomyces camponoticapitis TaxID=1616125 RepID=A0ABQ2E2C4_9ACTN|nr:hypothetical protein [Streptomyces camponoticapitis]GGJ87789.1 hypothetical protein GCM10011583_19130 [Streptomyces camponoticapitis]